MIGRQVALLGGATLVFAAVFFYATPRLGEGSWSGGRSATHAVTGYRNEARLEEFGRIHQSNQVVMRVSLTTIVQRKPYQMVGEPYFTGTALGVYEHDGEGGRWSPLNYPRTSRAFSQQMLERAQRSLTTSSQVRQEFKLEGGSAGSLFIIVPMQRLDETPRGLLFAPLSYRLAMSPDQEELPSAREFRYAAATSALHYGKQLRGVPHVNPLVTRPEELYHSDESRALLQFDEARFPKLAAQADEIVLAEQLETASMLDKALALERHFQSPLRYKYSLSLDFVRDKNLDPIEDFVANHRTGHCEYFASALVMMLRKQGIPARMVVGFRGGDLNSLGSYYQVREKHAHAWVEALLPASEVPLWDTAGQSTTGGVWYRLDPTPSSSEGLAQIGNEGVLNQVGDAFDYVEILWRDYVLSLNSAKQRDSIYDPVSSRALGSLPAWLESRSVNRLVRRLAAQLGWDLELPSGQSSKSTVFDWRIGALVALLLVVPLLLSQVAILLWRFSSRFRRGSQAARRRRAPPPRFYRQLKSLFSRLHLPANPGQTARELATAAGRRLQSPPTADVADLPAAIVDAYYRVRFGGAALDSREQAAIEQALEQLTPAVNQARL
jgi:hypothetical protein